MSLRGRLGVVAAAGVVAVSGFGLIGASAQAAGLSQLESVLSGAGVTIEGPGYGQLLPQLGSALDKGGAPLPDQLRLPGLPGDGMFWHVTWWNPVASAPPAGAKTCDVPMSGCEYLDHAGSGAMAPQWFVAVPRSSDWQLVVTEIDGGSTGDPVARLYMYCNEQHMNDTMESLTPYVDADGTLAVDQSLSAGGSWANDDVSAWLHRFVWSGL